MPLGHISMMIFKRVTIQATISIACDNESLDYDDEDVIRRLVFAAVREDPTYVARMLDIVNVATEIHEGAEGYTSLPDWAPEVLAAHEGNSLNLKNVKTLSEGAAKSLATFEGQELLLDGLSELTDAAAESLALHKGLLSLSLLESLSDHAAESLGSHVGRLVVGNLVRLSDNAARALARHRGPLSLSVYLPVSEFAFQALHTRANKDDELDIEAEPASPDKPVLVALGHEERKRVQELLESGTSDAVGAGLQQLEALQATAEECAKIFTDKAIRSTAGVAGEWLQGGDTTFAEYLRYHRLVVRQRFITRWREIPHTTGSFLRLVDIPAGSFTMGSPATEPGRRLDEHQTLVRIKAPFQLGQTPVTSLQWRAVMGTAPTGWASSDKYPIARVNWYEAELFCRLLTELEREIGLLSPKQAYRLPTEAEWEYACRGRTTTAYCFGNDPKDLQRYGWYDEHTKFRGAPEWHIEEENDACLHKLAENLPNDLDLFDMHGNVFEWCADWYSQQLAGGDDPVGPRVGSLKVCRGCSTWSSAEDCRSAARRPMDPDYRGNIGFRVVRSAS